MDFSSMNGYEFEKYITGILSNLGFQAQQTSLSGDGGVDIYAYYDKPFLKGYYLIQCKNWTSPVGQPEVRDLFGVVMSKRANKGILVTTSSFTEQAKEFANGLNIELIDGKALYEIAAPFSAENTATTTHPMLFYNDSSFEKDRYTYLKKRMESNRDYNSYEEHLAFLLSYVQPQSFDLLKHGLDKEIINICNDMLSRFCKNIKRDAAKRSEHVFIKAYLYFITGDIASCIECLNELGLFEFGLRADSYAPCYSETASDLRKYDLVIDDLAFSRKSYFYDYCNRRHVMVANLLILANTIEDNDLGEFERFISRGITSQDFSIKPYESIKTLNYLADFTMKAINQEERQGVSVAQRDYKWYPYYFTLKKNTDEYSIENTCYYKRAVSVNKSLVDSWDNLPQIRRKMNDMARVLGFFQTFTDSDEVNEDNKEEQKYDIILNEIGPNRLKVINTIHKLTDVGFKDVIKLIDRAPISLFIAVTKADADEIVEKLENVGAKCEIKQH